MTIGGKLIHSKLTMGHGKCQTDAEVRAPRACAQWGGERYRPPTLNLYHPRSCPPRYARALFQLDNILAQITAHVG